MHAKQVLTIDCYTYGHTLQGTNLDSVYHSEISVFVGGEPCNIEVPPSSEQVISQQSLVIEMLQVFQFFSNLAAVLLASTRST